MSGISPVRRSDGRHSCPPFARRTGLLPRITHHASRITYHFPMSKNVGSNAKPKLGKPFEPSNGGHKKFFGLIWLNLP
jgi:hypothetical protein